MRKKWRPSFEIFTRPTNHTNEKEVKEKKKENQSRLRTEEGS